MNVKNSPVVYITGAYYSNFALSKHVRKIPKGKWEAVNRTTDSTKFKWKRTGGQTMIYKTLHRKQKIEQLKPH